LDPDKRQRAELVLAQDAVFVFWKQVGEETEMSDTPLTDAVSKVPSEDQSTRGIAADWARFARSLERQLANLKQIQQDNIDSENDWRAAAGEWDESDSLCIESAATVIERLRAQLAERDAKFQERGAILLECALLIRKFRDRSFRLREDTAEVVDAFYLSLPATAKANAKIIEAAEKHEAEHSAWSEMEARKCRVCQAVREKKEFNP
jgi:hypothetical protein